MTGIKVPLSPGNHSLVTLIYDLEEAFEERKEEGNWKKAAAGRVKERDAEIAAECHGPSALKRIYFVQFESDSEYVVGSNWILSCHGAGLGPQKSYSFM